MPISLYASTVLPFLQILECQNSLIHKGAAHAEANGISPEKILRVRRDSRDESFRRHIVLGATAAIQVTVMLSEKKVKLPRPPYESFEDLARFNSVSKDYLSSLKEEHFSEAENKKFRLKFAGSDTVEATPAEVIFSHTYPTFYYHTVSAYSVLVHLGVGLKSWEFYNPPG